MGSTAPQLWLRAEPALSALPVVGFFSHVEAERGREAARAGCTTVLPRSAFVEVLPQSLPKWFTERDPP